MDYYVNIANAGIYFDYSDKANDILNEYNLKTNIPDDESATDLLKFLVDCNDAMTEIENNMGEIIAIEKEARQLKEKIIKKKERISEIDKTINQIGIKDTTTIDSLINNLQRNFNGIQSELQGYDRALQTHEISLNTIIEEIIKCTKDIGKKQKELEDIKKDLDLKNIAYELLLKGNFQNTLTVNMKYAIDYLEREIVQKTNILKEARQKKQVQVDKKIIMENKKQAVQRTISETKEKLNRAKLIIDNKVTERKEKTDYNKSKAVEITALQKEKNDLLKDVETMLKQHSTSIPEVKRLQAEYENLVVKYLNIFAKFNIYSDDIIDIETYWDDAKATFEAIESLLIPFGFSGIVNKFNNMNYVDGIKFITYANNQKVVVNPKFFSYLEYFSNIKEQYDLYQETLAELEKGILNAKDVADDIKGMSECIIDLIGSPNRPYTLGALGLFSNNRDFNTNTMYNNKIFCNNVINKLKSGSIVRSQAAGQKTVTLQNVYAEVTNILQKNDKEP